MDSNPCADSPDFDRVGELPVAADEHLEGADRLQHSRGRCVEQYDILKHSVEQYFKKSSLLDLYGAGTGIETGFGSLSP